MEGAPVLDSCSISTTRAAPGGKQVVTMSTASGRRTMPTHFAASGAVRGKAHGPHNKHAQQVLARRAAIERKRSTIKARLGRSRPNKTEPE